MVHDEQYDYLATVSSALLHSFTLLLSTAGVRALDG
jgi:hypothetical protein